MRIGDVIRVTEMPTVVQMASVARLKAGLAAGEDRQADLRFYAARYFLTERENRRVVETILASFAGEGRGFWVYGVYGSGKSHLLALIDLLASHTFARQVFAGAHPDMESLMAGLEGLYPVAVPLEEHRAEEALEDIVARRFEESLQPGGTAAALPEGRRERMAAMLGEVAARGRRGMVLLLDELFPFLAAKPKADLHRDASYLQFLGQRTALFPIWVVAALSGPVQSLDMDAELLVKVQDRFTGGLSLTIEHLRTLLHRKLLERNEAAWPEAMERAWTRAGGPEGAVSREAVRESYPFHPLTLEALMPLAGRFFSSTRSAVDFAVEAARASLEEDAACLIAPDRLYDYIRSRFAGHPAFAPCEEAVSALTAALIGDFPQAHTARLLKTLALTALTHPPLSTRQAASCHPYPGLEETASGLLASGALLEKLARLGGPLEADRHPGGGEDFWPLRLGWDERLFLRNRITRLARDLSPDDARIWDALHRHLPRERFLPIAFSVPRTADSEWLRSRRRCGVRWIDFRREGSLDACLAALADPQQAEDAFLCIARPGSVEAQTAAFAAGTASVAGAREGAALIALFPRPLADEEADVLREYAAFCLILEDPTLDEKRLGREGIAHLRSEKPRRDAEIALILEKLYGEGELRNADGPLAARLSGFARDWEGFLRSVMEDACARRYPEFHRFAPTRRVFSRSALQELMARFVRPGRALPESWSLLEVLLESVALPLSVAALEHTPDGSLYRLSAPAPALWQTVEEVLPPSGPVPIGRLAGTLRKSAFGLTAEQADLLLESCLRLGLLVEEKDEEGRRCARRGERLSAAYSARLRVLTDSLELCGVPEDVPGQQQVWDALIALRQSDPEAARLKWCALLTALNLGENAGQEEERLLEAAFPLLEAVDTSSVAREGLAAFLEAGSPADYPALGRLQGFLRFLDESPPLLDAWDYLTGAEFHLSEGHPLAAGRSRLAADFRDTGRIQQERGRILADFREWQAAYIEAYTAWHADRMGPERANAYRELRREAVWQVAGRLAKTRIGKESQERAESLLRESLSRQCPGFSLADALREAPLCPQCSLALGEEPEWADPEAILAAAREGVAQAVRTLLGGDRRDYLNRAAFRFPRKVRDRWLALQSLPLDTLPEDSRLPDILSDDLVEAVHQALEGRISAYRPLSSLALQLTGREMTKAEALSALSRWLDPEERLESRAWIAFEG
ncbi:MAG: hypothetical protein IT210_22745 [Armatimonadetes bacterium]|nr:hypothetical protein [Armatimonadota bacterium]